MGPLPYGSQSPSLRGSDRFGCFATRHTLGGSRVSIPFIAGQWSLRVTVINATPHEVTCLNPLHCGAVVASGSRSAGKGAGARLSQSPSLRGSGRFLARKSARKRRSKRLNPLHCGAVVAS